MSSDLEELGDKIKKAKGPTEEELREIEDELNNRQGLQAGVELMANMAAGGLIGYGIDYFAGTLPLFMILFFLLGVGSGFWSAYKISQNLGSGVGVKKADKKEE